MKKTLLITLEYPPFAGGIARYLSKLAEYLPAKKFLILTENTNRQNNFDYQQAYQIIRTNLLSRSPFIWPKWIRTIKLAKKVIEQEKIEHLLVGQLLPLGTVARIILSQKKIPFTVICHGTDIHNALAVNRKKRLAKNILAKAENIVTNSRYTANLLNQLADYRHKLSVLTPATDIAETAGQVDLDSLKKEYKLDERKVILTVGRLVKRKGHDLLIKALFLAKSRLPDFVCLVVGSGAEEKKLKALADKYSLSANIIFTGQVSENKLVGFYQAADVFVLPSRQEEKEAEGFGLVFLEANAFAKPVIGGKSGGVGEAVVDGQTGLLVDPRNPKDLAQALVRLLTNSSLAQKLGQAGQQRVKEEFNWQDRAHQLIKLLA